MLQYRFCKQVSAIWLLTLTLILTSSVGMPGKLIAGTPAPAEQHYAQHESAGTHAPARAEMMLKCAENLERARKVASAIEWNRKVVIEYPGTVEATLATQNLLRLGGIVPTESEYKPTSHRSRLISQAHLRVANTPVLLISRRSAL
jgi:hypothetical protein